ncbi:MAG: DUF2029 domain-containing protein [Chloroflexaceae bacterium]|nr:DUF2029 domain-containing protein [Chloroflexaceae bacterium]
MMNHYPRTLADHPEVTLGIGPRTLLTLVPVRESRSYHVLLPAQDRPGWSVPVLLHSTTVTPKDDPRPLGFVLVGASLRPTVGFPPFPLDWPVAPWLKPGGGFPLLPPAWQLLAFLLLSAAFYIFMRGIGAPRWLAWLASVSLVVGLGMALVLLPMQIAPFTMRLAALAGLGAIYGITVQVVREGPGRRAWVATSRIPILMGVACWLMPVYQLVMTADGVSSVAPYPPMLWVAGGALVLGAVGVAVLADGRSLHHWPRLVLLVLALAAVARLVVMLEFVMDHSGIAFACVAIGFGFVLVSAAIRPVWALLPLGGLALAAIIGLAMTADPWLGRSAPDFWILFKGARDWLHGGSLYDLVAVHTNHFGHVFKVPPFYGMLFVPFVEQDGLTVLFWHRIINMSLISLILLIMLRGFAIRLVSPLGVALVMLFAMRPLADTVAYGQIDLVLLLLLTLALVASQRGRDTVAGVAVALGTLFKLYPVLLLVFFAAKLQWRALVGFVVAMLVLNGVAMVVMGWEMHYLYLYEVLPNIAGGTAWVENQTFNGFLSRIFAPDITAEIYAYLPVDTWTRLIFGAAVALAALLALRPTERTSSRYALQFGLFVLLMVLVVPAAWMHYETIVILTFAGVLLCASHRGLPLWRAALFGGSYALIAYGNQWSFYTNRVLGGLTVIGVSYKFYGLVLLLLVTVACLVERPRAFPQPGTEAERKLLTVTR